MRKPAVRILALRVVGLLLTASGARALNLVTTASLLTAPPPNGQNDAPDCLMQGTAGPTSCATSAGAETTARSPPFPRTAGWSAHR